MSELQDYRYRGARALVLLHEQSLRDFVEVWRKAKAAAVELPPSPEPAYASLDALLWHVLYCARSYMVWICVHLELPDPEIRAAPEASLAEAEVDGYLEHLFERWRLPLAGVEERRFHRPEHTSKWGVLYCVDAMLEHAVMHPIRHRFQLLELLA